ncbi:phenylacetate--CoA ligase family protein [Blastopirellula marina]|uniref:CoF synthetase n=1 Tax=Blastopirellula marina TaxID=124 RepID=A0A2S8FW70_9BACT|nr:AMP-binding protein [Blastopirellula marina]PQO36432.1 CoF synthetase [Blastopirellula marina]PTL44269.1 phenylacetate--CoA ligase family protein [Blastopirellula marina]
MTTYTPAQRDELRRLNASQLAAHQLAKFNALVAEILPHNAFYADKLGSLRHPLESLDDIAELPFTFKDELVGKVESGDLAANRTYPIERYVRFHRTSGTRGRPMVVLDTASDWQWWLDGWQFVLDAAEIGPEDRCFLAFSFGPFVGFWSAFDAVAARGCLAIPSGGLSTVARLELIRQNGATALFCTPTYALHLAEVAHHHKMDIAASNVHRIILAGEPGGSIPNVRQKIESAWNAKVIDHTGATEIGPWGFSDDKQRGVYVNEAFFLPEFISVETGRAAGERELAELVITTLGRSGAPVIRYRTGDLVRPSWNHNGPCNFVLLEGGVLGRADDMLIIRGVNVFPSSVEQIVRGFPEVVEFRMTAFKQGQMDQLSVEIEDRLHKPERVAKELQIRLGLRIEVTSVEIGSLPRFEGKGRRFVDQRHAS